MIVHVFGQFMTGLSTEHTHNFVTERFGILPQIDFLDTPDRDFQVESVFRI